MPLSIVSTEPESSSANQLSVVSSNPVQKVTPADIEKVAKEYGVPADLAVGVAHIESAYDPLAKSNKGAQGIMQLMPATAQRYGVTDSYDPEQNIRGGVQYLRDLLKQFGGDRDKALAAYNWGEKHVADGKEVPSSVQQYVKDVSGKAKEHAWANLKVVSTEPDTGAQGKQTEYTPEMRMQYAKPGSYTTQLSPEDEQKFQSWVKEKHVPFEDDGPKSTYDMRGFWKAMTSGDQRAKQGVSTSDNKIHFVDTWKTPYHETFSKDSIYAKPDAPQWTEGDELVDSKGKVLFSGARSSKYMVTPDPKGLVEAGNLPIQNRPVVKNADGSVSTEYSTSFFDERPGHVHAEVLIPTVVDGKFLTSDGKKPPEKSKAEQAMFKAAWEHYEKTGENLGKFKTYQDANAYAKALHERGDQKQGDKKPLSIVSTEPEPAQSLPGQEKPMAGAPQDWAKQALAQSGVTAPVAGPAAPPPIPSRVGYITGAPVPPTPNIEEINKKQDEANQKMFTHPLIPHGEEMVEEHRKLAETVDAKKHPVIAWLADADVVGAQTLVGLSTPANLALLGVMALAPEASVVKRLVDAGFSVQMAKQAYEQFKSGQKAKEQGNDREAHRQWMGGALSAIFAGLAGHGATKGEKIIGSKEEPVHAETPETIGKQVDALKAGTVSTVMIPQGGKVPAVPESMQSVTVDKGKGAGTYIFDPKKISAETIRQAAESGKHGELLGHVQSKAELADKPKVVVQARAEDGTPVQESVVENKPEVVAAQTKVLEDRHPDAEVTVTTPQEVLGERAGVPVEQREAADEGKEPVEAEKPQEGAPASTEPASIIKVPIGSLVLDPNRFQYKLNVDEKGVSNILKGRKWNPDLAGVVSVWQDPRDEELYVVNGHHRVDLARENGVQNLDVRVINADNAKEARSIGALQNIAEGRGTAVDAAKFFRDTGRGEKDLENEGITLSESKAADGVALAKLSQPIFDEVAQGRMRVGRGVAIGNATDDLAQQEAILKMIEKREKSGKAIPDSVVAELGRMAKGAKDKTETQDTLFGVQSMTRNLLLEKAEVSDYIRKQIGSEKKLFTTVGTESTAQRLGKAGNVIDAGENAKIAQQAAQAQELYDRFSVKTGEINDILNRAADELSNGESPNAVKQRAYEETRAALSQTLGQGVENRGEGVQAGPRTGEAEAHAEPAAGKREGAVKGPLTEVKLRAELAKHPNITPEQRDAMVTVWKQFAEKYLGMDFDQFLNRYWKDIKVGGEYAGEEGLQQRGAVTWAYHPQKGLLTDRAGRKGHEQLLHEAGVDYMGGRAYDKLPRGRAIVDPYSSSVVVTLQGDGHLTPAAERELRRALDVPDNYEVRTTHGSMLDAVRAGHDRVLFQQANPVWYSKLERIVGDAPIKSSASGEQWMRMLQNKGVKASEIEATGLDEFLKGKSKVSRDEVSEFVKANQIEVKEVMKGVSDTEANLNQILTQRTRSEERVDLGSRTVGLSQEARNKLFIDIRQGKFSAERDDTATVLKQMQDAGYMTKDESPDPWWDHLAESVNRASILDREVNKLSDQLTAEKRDGGGPAKFAQHVLPGGENYRELLLTLPEKAKPTFEQWAKKIEQETGLPQEDTPENRHIYESDTGYQNLRRPTSFTGGHFDEPNVLAHIRFNDRTDADGKRVLFMEEVQSDWHQKGRKQGYKTDVGKEDAQRRLDESYNKVRPLLTKADLLGYDFATDALRDIKSGALQIDQIDETGVPGLREAAAEYRDAYAAWEPFALSKDSQAVPDAPFKKDWHELALRRMLRYAAENGYDKVAWTTGKMQVERYPEALRQVVDNIKWGKEGYDQSNVVRAYKNGGGVFQATFSNDGRILSSTPESAQGKHLSEVFGKTMAEQILAEHHGEIAGKDFTVGGEGMKGFYDKILPDYLNKYGKKFGAKVGKTEIETTDPLNYEIRYEGPERTIEEVQKAYDATQERGNTMVSPITGQRLQFSVERVSNSSSLTDILVDMKRGSSFSEAMKDNANYDIAEMMGGKMIKGEPEKAITAVHSLDITPELHKAVMEGQPLFQGKAGEVKGATQFMEDGKAIVSLYNSADFSTFAHESFHVMRPHLKPEDTAILEREFGVKDGKWTTAHEETAARSWERYLRDGEAPSPKLADVFAKIKAWMVGIYQHLAGTELEKNVSPAVREVFDRMLGKEDSVSAETGEQPRPVDPNQEVMFQRRKRAETEPSGLLPGMEEVPEERKQAAAEAEGETLTGELTQPKGDISRAAGEMEQKSPLFRGTEASPQNEMFGDEGQTKLFSGIPPPEEFVKQFRTVFPSVAKRFDDWVSGEPTIGGEQKATMRQTRGEMDRSLSVVAEKLKSYKKEWVPRPREDFRKFAQAVEGLIPVDQLSPRDQELANIFKSGFDEIRSQIRALKPEVLQSYIEHYFPHIWERPGVAEKAVRNVLASKRPFAGSERFRQKRTVPTIEDGLDLGLNPVSWNPVDMFLLKYKEEAQFLMAHKTLDMMKDNGNAKRVQINQASPEGWVKLDDRIGTVYGKEQVQTVEPGQDELYDEGGKPRSFTVIRGHYWAPPEAAKVFNNFVSRGFAGRYTTYDIAQGLNSNLNALQLGISAFHVTTTSVNAATSDIALGLQQLREGKIVEGATRIGSGVATLPSVANTLRNGSKLMKEYLTPGSYEKFSREANAVEQAGGRAKQQTIQLHALDNFMNAIKNRAYGDAAKAAPSAIIEASVWPVMEYYVPRMKFGAFYNMAHDILERADRENWPEERTRARMQRAWDSVDNRFGQMVYDNLFWKKSVRDSLQLATRSVGWNFGTIRELGGAVPDLIKETARVSKGEAPEISDRVAFAFALAGYTAMVGATMTYLMTGKRPQTWKDYYYPRQADGTRMSIPGYMKDVVAYMHDPKQTVMNKMGPLIELTAEAIQNRDFYGTEIRHKDDPAIRQLWQFAKFVGNTAMPFSISGSKKLVQKAGGDTSTIGGTIKGGLRHPGQVAAGQFGFQPAPAFIQHSPALNKAYEYEFSNRPPGTRTQEQADHHDNVRIVTDMFRNDKVDESKIDKMITDGKIGPEDVEKAEQNSKVDPLELAARSLYLDQLLTVFASATDDEKEMLRPIIVKKGNQIMKERDPDRRKAMIKAYFNAINEEPEQDEGGDQE